MINVVNLMNTITVVIAIVSYRVVSPASRPPFKRRWYMYSSEDDDGSPSASLAHHLLFAD